MTLKVDLVTMAAASPLDALIEHEDPTPLFELHEEVPTRRAADEKIFF